MVIAVAGIITIVRGMRELLNHRGRFGEKKTLTDNEGSAFRTLTSGWSFQPNNNWSTVLADSGATEHIQDDELIPELEVRFLNPAPLNMPETMAY